MKAVGAPHNLSKKFGRKQKVTIFIVYFMHFTLGGSVTIENAIDSFLLIYIKKI